MFSITRKKYVCDLEGNKLYTVRNKWINWFVHKACIYDSSNNNVATVKYKMFNVNNEYFITSYKDEIQLKGGSFSTSSQILKNSEVIGTINRQITIVNDAFELEANESDIPFLIVIVIAIDNIVDKKRKK